ncbi:MAG: 16S rRNA (guanine(527)-N(7))-methyltransferase RsmG [Acuticoccus sp.]
MDEQETAARDAIRARLGAAEFGRLQTLVGLCESWGAVSNLVSHADRTRLWSRHVADSLQLVEVPPSGARRWIDLGSGAGFPGLVVALVRPDTRMLLVESNKKKAAFLIRAAAECGIDVRVESRRAEVLDAAAYDVVSARALAPLHKLFNLSVGFFGKETVGLFPKGRDAATEIDMARQEYQFDLETRPSLTDPDGAILVVTNLVRV